jgi:hypothetical protein
MTRVLILCVYRRARPTSTPSTQTTAATVTLLALTSYSGVCCVALCCVRVIRAHAQQRRERPLARALHCYSTGTHSAGYSHSGRGAVSRCVSRLHPLSRQNSRIPQPGALRQLVPQSARRLGGVGAWTRAGERGGGGDVVCDVCVHAWKVLL